MLMLPLSLTWQLYPRVPTMLGPVLSASCSYGPQTIEKQHELAVVVQAMMTDANDLAGACAVSDPVGTDCAGCVR